MKNSITNKSIFELYTVELDSKLEELETRLKVVTRTRTKLLIWFKYNTKIRNRVFNKDEYILDKILPISLPSLPIEKYYNIQLDNFKSFNSEFNKLQTTKHKLLSLKIDEKIFTSILIKFNTKLVDSIITEDYSFNHPYLGNIGKHLNKRVKPAVDWSTSNKNKAKLLEEGKIPELKKDRLLAQEQGKEYKGEPWLSYLSPFNYYFKWSFNYSHTILFFNIKNYVFIPYRGETSPTMKLYNYRNTFTEEQLINQYNTIKNAN